MYLSFSSEAGGVILVVLVLVVMLGLPLMFAASWVCGKMERYYNTLASQVRKNIGSAGDKAVREIWDSTEKTLRKHFDDSF